MMHQDGTHHADSAVDMRTRTQLEQRNGMQMIPPLDILSVGRESNAAISIKNLQQMRKQVPGNSKVDES